MIKFFRQIRQKLLTENSPTRIGRAGKFSKPASRMARYLKYAIGEIILVVIGILIALGLNNWNQNRIVKNQFNNYLKDFTKDLATDTLSFKRGIAKYEEMIYNGQVLLTSDDFIDLPTDSILLKLPLSAMAYKINGQTFDKLKNSGVSSAKIPQGLYDQITRYYTYTNDRYDSFMAWEYEDTQKDNEFILNQSQYEIRVSDESGDSIILNTIPYKQSEAERKKLLIKQLSSMRVINNIRMSIYRKKTILDIFNKINSEARTLLSAIQKEIDKSNERQNFETK